ncbi:MAG: hypothetical protein ACLRWQ_10290 [Flavonifractor plautii]
MTTEKKWDFHRHGAKAGDEVVGGDVLGTVPETAVVLHKIMVPPSVEGTVRVWQQPARINVTETSGRADRQTTAQK